MYGKGILKGLGVTLKRFVNTYVDDIAWWGRRYYKPEGIAHRSSKDARGIFTIQYPEEKLPSPEEFRYVPFLVYDETEDGEKAVRCTSCGICAKVCPPQCIWIVRTSDPKTGKPVPVAGRVLHRRRYLHELRFLRRVLPVRCHQDGSRLRDRLLRAQRLQYGGAA